MFPALSRNVIVAIVLLFSSQSSSASSGSTAPHCLNNDGLLSTNLACSSNGASDIVTLLGKDQNSISVDSPVAYFHPWSYQPVCTQVLESIGSELCVYTNSTFSNGRGISIFTLPKIAEHFAKLLPFQDPTALDGINSRGGSWYTEELPGKGTGLIADRILERGDLITAYTPVLLVYMDKVLSTRDREIFLRIAIDQLPSASREAYLSLSTIYGNPTVIAQDVLKANNFEIQVRREMHLAVFPETSRMNHDCAPNSQYYLDPARLIHYVHAARSISTNEEITISYTSPLQPYADRRSYLQNAFHFICRCARCKSGKYSDAILTQINSLQKTLANWSPGSTATTEIADELVRLYEEQDLHGFLDSGYGLAALTYNSFGDTEVAKKYAKLAAEIVAMKDGPEVADYESWNSVANDPEGHWSWRVRVSR